MVIKVHLASSWTKSNHISCTYTVMNGNHNWTRRPSPRWSDGSRQVILTDFCEDSCGVVPAIADPVAEWPATVAEALLNLGLSCTESWRGAAPVNCSLHSQCSCTDEAASFSSFSVAKGMRCVLGGRKLEEGRTASSHVSIWSAKRLSNSGKCCPYWFCYRKCATRSVLQHFRSISKCNNNECRC